MQLYVHDQDETVSSRMSEFGVWEPTETEWFMTLVDEGSRVIDVGANIGYYTLLASSLVGSEGSVMALEPDNRNYQLLEKNTKEYGQHNITLVKKAVAADEGSGVLYLSDSNYGDHRTYSSDNSDSSYAVATTSLDQILTDSLKRVDMLKIDCQGAEAEILKGAIQLFEESNRMPKCMLLEFWPYGLYQSGSSVDEFFSLIPHEQYEIWNLGPWDHQAAYTDVNSLKELAGKEVNPASKPYTFFTNLVFIHKSENKLLAKARGLSQR